MHLIEDIFTAFVGILEATLKFIFEFLETSITGIAKPGKGYNARFASPDIVMSRREHGFCLTGKRNLSVKNSYENSLIIGGTGTGKSSVVLLPSLYTMNGSFIIHDPNGELFAKSAGYLQKKGFIKVLNFADPNSSSLYNPLARAKTSSEIQKVASLLVENAMGSKGKDPFWTLMAVSLLAMLITIVKTQEEQYQNLANVRQLLNLLGANPKAVDSLFAKYADEKLFAEYKSFIGYDEKIVTGVTATCKAALQLFADDSLAQVTASDNIEFELFRKQRVALYIRNSVADQRYYSVLTSIFFEQFFAYILSRLPEEAEQDIFLLIDEASSLHLPTLSLAFANVRKHRAGCMILLQDFNQLITQYGKNTADAIRANCFSRLYFTGQSLDTTKELEATLGKYTYKNDKGTEVVRPLMTNDEIRTMKKSTALLICGNNLPIVVKLRPYYKHKPFRDYSKLPAVTVTENAGKAVSLLDLDTGHE